HEITLQEELMDYGAEDLATIVQKASSCVVARNAAMRIARASIGTPRKSSAFLVATEDQVLALGQQHIDTNSVNKTLKRRRLDGMGLGPRHQQAQQILRTERRPIGQTRLSIALGLEREVFKATVGPELIRMGLITVTPRVFDRLLRNH
ncbi:MAG: Holliday junction resolvasome RuvABC ATP-dependent DNA helicase subunit, partial [Planctomycetota bacterium]